MNANDVMREMLKRENVSPERASAMMGRSRSYMSALLAKRSDPRVSTLVQACDVLDYELVARSCSDGYEFIIGS